MLKMASMIMDTQLSSMWKRNLQVFKDSWSVLYFTIHQILYEDLWKRKICTKFAPHRLTNEQKQHRLASCQSFIHTHQDNHCFLYCILLFPKMTRWQLPSKERRHWRYCEMLRVLLTPTCHVSGYPRQVIKVDACLDDYALFGQRYQQL
jgi:hypothetical protein